MRFSLMYSEILASDVKLSKESYARGVPHLHRNGECDNLQPSAFSSAVRRCFGLGIDDLLRSYNGGHDFVRRPA